MHVIVVGTGVIGLATAHALLSDGHQVTVVDREVEAARGTSQANGAFLSASHCAPWAAPGIPGMALRSLFDRQGPFHWRFDGTVAQLSWLAAMLRLCNPLSFSLNRGRMVRIGRYSRQCLDEVREATGVGFEGQATGTLLLVSDPSRLAASRAQVESLGGEGFRARLVEGPALLELEPGLADAKPSVVAGVLVEDDATGDCRQFCLGLQAWLRERGVTFIEGRAVTRLRARAGRFEALVLDRDEIAAEACVLAAGTGSARLLDGIVRLPVYPVKGYSMTLTVGETELAPRHGVLDDIGKLAIARLGSRIRVAGVAEVSGYSLAPSPTRQNQLFEGFKRLYPRAADASPPSFWAGLRPMTPDGPPLIGHTPVEGLFMNTGHGTYGWTMACGSARLLADLIAGRPTALPIDDYSLGRRNH